jgi:hypothetical protein
LNNNYKGKSSFILLVIILLSVLSCEYDNADSTYWDSLGEIKFSEEVSPLITTHCNITGCHINGSPTGDFSDYNQLKQRVDNGKFQKMVFDLKLMPPASSPQLNETEYRTLERWLAGGASL